MLVQLVLATGSNAGLAAPLQRGYYMIGRHRECQIRPKTRSVSRRHCLLFHDEQALRVLDLGSTSGTKINDILIEPRCWHELSSGDTLRLGKTVFTVSIAEPSPNEFSRSTAESAKIPTTLDAKQKPLSRPKVETQPVAKAQMANSGSTIRQTPQVAGIVSGEAWQDFDVAGFLENADTQDRELRYASIREQDAVRRAKQLEDDEDLDDDSDVFDDTPLESDETTLLDHNSAIGKAGSHASGTPASGKAAALGKASLNGSAGPSRPRLAPKAKPSSRLPSISIDLEQVKTYAAVLLTLMVLSYAAYAAYRFVQGTPANVVEGID